MTTTARTRRDLATRLEQIREASQRYDRRSDIDHLRNLLCDVDYELGLVVRDMEAPIAGRRPSTDGLRDGLAREVA